MTLNKNDEKQEKQNWIFTFGCGHRYAGHYVKIYGTYSAARKQMFDRFGDKWCAQYTETEYFDSPYPKATELVMSTDMIISEILKMKAHNQTFAPNEIFTTAISALKKLDEIAELIDETDDDPLIIKIYDIINRGNVADDSD